MSRKISSLIVLVALPLFGQACIPPWWLFEDDDDDTIYYTDDGFDPPPPNTNPTNSSPDIVDINIADWPPIGPDTELEIDVQDVDGNLSSVEFTFRETIRLSPPGGGGILNVNGWQLGEGYGTLTIEASDTEGATATRWVEDLLVDLTDPEITLGDTVVPGDGFVEAWVADAWVLGSATLRVGNIVLEHDFEDGYPSTIGVEWDYSLVKFDTSLLPEGHSEATLTAYDAAGNSTDASFTLTVDSTPPSVQITSPVANSSVSGLFEVHISASDPGDGPVWIEVSVGGTPAASAVGPSAVIVLDAGELTPGTVDLEAVAVDQAGNRSLIATVPIIVQ